MERPRVQIATTLVMNPATGRAMVLGEVTAGDELLRAFVADPHDVGLDPPELEEPAP